MHKKILFMVLLTLLASTLALAGARILFYLPSSKSYNLGTMPNIRSSTELESQPPGDKAWLVNMYDGDKMEFARDSQRCVRPPRRF